MIRTGNTKIRALIEAKKLLQEVGYNGFSFQHIADALQIKKSSMYVHFKSKEDLGKCLIEEQRASFTAWTKTIEVFAPDAQIGALFEIYQQFSADTKKLCPLSALGTDFNSLPKSMRPALSKLYTFCFAWLETIIKNGQDQHLFRKDKTPVELAKLVFAAGLGAQLCARLSNDPHQVRGIKQQILSILSVNQTVKKTARKTK
ncbi:MAG: TetR/AcrR family transcriptional regulator [Gammaproteobacteria bacterium]|nr:TetR/AcrR family transcriptional regulator [Gammaproteobacteria bacterium]